MHREARKGWARKGLKLRLPVLSCLRKLESLGSVLLQSFAFRASPRVLGLRGFRVEGPKPCG